MHNVGIAIWLLGHFGGAIWLVCAYLIGLVVIAIMCFSALAETHNLHEKEAR